MLQSIVHYSLHFIVIALVAYWYDSKNWKKNWLILLSTMAIDSDHVLANPVFDPDRCGIGFHPLHSGPAILFYIAGLIIVKNKVVKLIFIGLLFHIITDFIDCLWLFSKCEECYVSSEIYKYLHLFFR